MLHDSKDRNKNFEPLSPDVCLYLGVNLRCVNIPASGKAQERGSQGVFSSPERGLPRYSLGLDQRNRGVQEPGPRLGLNPARDTCPTGGF